MTRTGERLREFAARWCCADTMTAVIDPLIADVQHEHESAIQAGQVWRSRRLLVAAWYVFVKVLAICLWADARPSRWSDADRKAVVRALAVTAAVMVVVTAVLEIPPLMVLTKNSRVDSSLLFRLVLTLVPQALTLAVTIGATLGIAIGVGRRTIARRVAGALIVVALAASMASFVNVAWIVPAANQAFRVGVSRALGLPGEPPKGVPELTLEEIRGEMDRVDRYDRSAGPFRPWPADASTFDGYAHSLALSYYERWAIAFSPVFFSLFALSIGGRSAVRRWTLAAAASAGLFSYYMFTYGARTLVFRGSLPASVAAWFPNVLLAALAVLLTVRRSRVSVWHVPAR